MTGALAARPITDRGLQVAELTTLAELEALRPEWSALWARVPDASPFQSPEWLVPWWRSFGPTAGELLVLTMRAHGTLVGLLPLYLHPPAGGTSRRCLILGTGNSDHLDPLFHPDHAPACAQTALGSLAPRRGWWAECDLQQLRPTSPLFAARPPRGCAAERHEGAACPTIPLGHSAAGAPPPAGSLWPRLAYLRRRASRDARMRIVEADARTLDETLDLLVGLHAARWGARGEAGVLADTAVRTFLRDASSALLDAGMLRLYVLHLYDAPAAAVLAIAGVRAVAYYIGGFDPAHAALGPGTLLVGHAIEEAARGGAREFDFLRGAEPYKYRWGAVDCPTSGLVLRWSPR